jgi:N-acetyl-gamma-glutamyl-phosphate reductase
MQKTIRAKIVGAGGYGGTGIIELLLRHPHIKIASLVDIEGKGGPISAIWPHLSGMCDMIIQGPDEPGADADCDVVIFATPDRVGQAGAAKEVARGRRVVDFSGDFRSPDEKVYAEYASRIKLETRHLAPELLPKSAYGLAELHREAIRRAAVVGNPGCFAAACLLASMPAVRAGLIDGSKIIFDAKTGISGAGKKPKAQFHYPEAYENTYAYRLSGHQHVMEIETQLGRLGRGPVTATFTPQVVPMTRGILACAYAPMAAGVTQDKALEAYRAAYAKEPFVRVFGPDGPVATTVVRGSNYCNIAVACDARTGIFRAISAIDNLMKGQASNAVQNINVMFGLPEDAGLSVPGRHP